MDLVTYAKKPRENVVLSNVEIDIVRFISQRE